MEKDSQNAPGGTRAKTKWLLAVVVALIAGVTWFAVHREPGGVFLVPTPTPTPTSTPTAEAGANAAFNRGNDKAISDYTEAIRLRPDDADAYFLRGHAYYLKKEYDKAISDETEAIRLKPDYSAAYYTRGSAYKMQGELGRAKADLAKALELQKAGH
jgi:Flp pilus assembly protein TadD